MLCLALIGDFRATSTAAAADDDDDDDENPKEHNRGELTNKLPFGRVPWRVGSRFRLLGQWLGCGEHPYFIPLFGFGKFLLYKYR